VSRDDSMAGRGALIVLEGCDRAGKSTQCKKLVQALIENGKRAKLVAFPGKYQRFATLTRKNRCSSFPPRFLHADRKTKIGEMIGEYLTCKSELEDHVIHLLFSANRWEAMYACSHAPPESL